jgi:Fic family protein
LVRPSLKLRKENKIKTIHHSLAIEGNTLTQEQVTALLEKKRVIGPKKQIREVINALNLYDRILSFDSLSEKDPLKAKNDIPYLIKACIFHYVSHSPKD